MTSPRKKLGLMGVFAIATGSMLSSGVFILPALAYQRIGPATLTAYALAALLVVPVIFSKAEMASALPKMGGSYFFIERSLGPWAGTVAGAIHWISMVAKTAFAFAAFGALAGGILVPESEIWARVFAVGACFAMAGVQSFGVRAAGALQIGLCAVVLAILVAYSLSSLPHASPTAFVPLIPENLHDLFAMAAMVCITFGGLTKVVEVSEDIEKPGRNLPLGILLAYLAVSAVYLLCVAAAIGLAGGGIDKNELFFLSASANRSAGPYLIFFIHIAALIAFATEASVGLLSASRVPAAMSRDGILPEFMARSHGRGVPHMGLWVTALAVVACDAFLGVESIAKTASAMALLMFIAVEISCVVLGRAGLVNYRPVFHAPLHPWLQIAAVFVYAFLLVEIGQGHFLAVAGVAAVASLWYFLYPSRRIERESALVHWVRRVASAEYQPSDLESELKCITLERDKISLDRFDQILERAIVLDIEDRLTATDLLRRAAEAMAPRLGLAAEHLFQRLVQRERLSSTAMGDGLAIPHAILDGEKIFELLIARCRQGAQFGELQEPVKIVFVMASTPDERNFHLRALMSIARIASDKEFRARWNNVGPAEQLRDLAILARKVRKEP